MLSTLAVGKHLDRGRPLVVGPAGAMISWYCVPARAPRAVDDLGEELVVHLRDLDADGGDEPRIARAEARGR